MGPGRIECLTDAHAERGLHCFPVPLFLMRLASTNVQWCNVGAAALHAMYDFTSGLYRCVE